MTDTPTPRRPQTDQLLQRLAAEAGLSPPRRLSLIWQLLMASTVAAAVSLGVVLTVAGARSDLALVVGTWIFLFKAIAMLLLAAGAFMLVRGAARPGRAIRPLYALAPAFVFLAASTAFDRSGLSLGGARPPVSILACVGTIVLASLPALGLILGVMKQGIPTDLRAAGFQAGLLAGSIGALAYTVACVNDGAAFVAVWYSAAVVAAGCLGALAGPRWLAW